MSNGAARPAWIVPICFAAATAVLWYLWSLHPARIASDLAQPLWVVTNWGAYGALVLAVLGAALALGMWAYVRVPSTVPTRTIVAASVLAMAAGLLSPYVFSSDVYAYAAYGEMSRIGMNPYGHALLPHGNAIFNATIWQWGNPPPVCVYGPAFVGLASAIVWALGHLGALAALEGFRIAACAALTGCTILALRAYPGNSAERNLAAVTIGLNPVLIWSAIEGHNDAIALFVVLAGFALVGRGFPTLGAFAVALAGSIELPGALSALPPVGRTRNLRVGALAGLAATAVLSLPLLAGTAAHVAPHGRFAPQASFQAIVKPAISAMTGSDSTATVVTVVVAVLLAIALASRGLPLLRHGEREGWLHVAIGAWIVIPNPFPWYGTWFVAVAALAPRSEAAVALRWLVLFSILRYVPDAVGALSPMQSVVLGAIASLPLLIAIPRYSSSTGLFEGISRSK